jgi:hypothetical protein
MFINAVGESVLRIQTCTDTHTMVEEKHADYDVVQGHQRHCVLMVEEKQALKVAGIRVRCAVDEVTTWEHKTKSFYVGQPKTKKLYRAKWDDGTAELRSAQATHAFLRTQLCVNEQQFHSQLLHSTRSTDFLMKPTVEGAPLKLVCTSSPTRVNISNT